MTDERKKEILDRIRALLEELGVELQANIAVIEKKKAVLKNTL